MNRKTLILGGVRSGKSRLAERLAHASRFPVTYIATATADDDEMRTRIAAHRAQRPVDWQLIEEPVHLAMALRTHSTSGGCILVDCLTLWLTNLLMLEDIAVFESEREALLSVLPELAGQIVMVGNETNMGIIPMGDLSRRFCDQSGRLHQDLARICDRVILTVAGLPQVLKGDPI